MKRDQGLSETVSVILIIGMVLILAIVIAGLVLGVNIIPQNPAYIAVDIQKIPVSGTEVISIFHRAGDAASLKNITDKQQYVLSFYVDTTSGSYRLQPPSGVDIFSSGTTLFVYNTSTGIYKITNNSADLLSAPPPISLTSVRLIDEKSHQLIAQWKNSTGGATVLPLTVTGISPSTGSTFGGTIVTITGTNLFGAAAGGANGVTFGGAAATGVSVNSATQITATTSSHAAGAVNVVVTTPNGTVTGTTGAYTYVDPPTFGSIAPPTGPIAGGTIVTITGTNLIGAAAGGVNGVTFDGIAATGISVVSGASITATTPGHATAGAVNVVVTTPNGTATGTGVYTYVAPPTVISIAPPTGSIAGGIPVTITGTDLIGATSVTFDGTPATGVSVVSGASITANTPGHATAGAVNVVVTTPNGTATGTGAYTYTIPITAIDAITGTPQVGSVLTAGALTPSGATETYHWKSSTTSGGTYTNIKGATSATYTPVAGDIGYYIKVVATGTGSYSNTVTSANIGPVTAIPITAIGAITGTPQVGSVLTAGALTPSGATASYQWSRSTTAGGTYTAISGATSATYTPVAGDISYYIRVVATGTGGYTGTVTSAAVGPVARIPITAIGAITGTPQTGSVLTAGALTPSGATASYQWSRSTTAGGTYTSISGATSATYTPVTGDRSYYIKVTATGTGSYTGTVTSAAAGPVTTPITAIAAFTGTLRSGRTLTAGALTPSGATASYQWQRSTTSGGTYTAISGATSNTYILVAGDITYYIRVAATGTGSYTGTVTSAARGPVTA